MRDPKGPEPDQGRRDFLKGVVVAPLGGAASAGLPAVDRAALARALVAYRRAARECGAVETRLRGHLDSLRAPARLFFGAPRATEALSESATLAGQLPQLQAQRRQLLEQLLPQLDQRGVLLGGVEGLRWSKDVAGAVDGESVLTPALLRQAHHAADGAQSTVLREWDANLGALQGRQQQLSTIYERVRDELRRVLPARGHDDTRYEERLLHHLHAISERVPDNTDPIVHLRDPESIRSVVADHLTTDACRDIERTVTTDVQQRQAADLARRERLRSDLQQLFRGPVLLEGQEFFVVLAAPQPAITTALEQVLRYRRATREISLPPGQHLVAILSAPGETLRLAPLDIRVPAPGYALRLPAPLAESLVDISEGGVNFRMSADADPVAGYRLLARANSRLAKNLNRLQRLAGWA